MKAILPGAGKFALALTIAFSAVVMIKAQSTHQVSVSDFSFSPSTLEIESGDTVVWTNTQGSHNVNGTQDTYSGNPASFGNDVGTGWTYTFIFTEPGTYDYQCDPHVGMGMVGQVIVSDNGGGESAGITIDFSSMTPHLNQDLWFALVDQESGEIVQRIHDTVTTESFSVVFSEVETGRSYNIDFYADHNGSGNYNSPPDDHAWRLEVDNLEGDTTLTFVHNTDFTDIEWKYAITLDFSNMTPHLGQMLVVYFVDENDAYVDTVTIDEVSEAEFEVSSFNVDTGASYRIDFFADLNNNGTYDAPPVDHAWRIEIESLDGDTVVPFVHNTEFTDIFETPTPVNNRRFTKLVIYPNPAGDFIKVSGNDVPEGDLDIRVLSITGQILRSMKAANNGDLQIDLTGLSKGSYFLQIRSKKYNAQAKFVKLY